MLQACLNGGRTRAEAPGVPLTPADLARDAVAARKAGAQELHVHPRNIAGAETLAPADVAAALRAIRAAVPKMKVGIGTGAWIAPGGKKRHAHLEAWQEKPDYVSVNMNEPDASQVMTLMHKMGIGIEAGHLKRLFTYGFTTKQDGHGFGLHSCLNTMREMKSATFALSKTHHYLVVHLG